MVARVYLGYRFGVDEILPLPKRWLETVSDMAECRIQWHSCVRNLFSSSTYYWSCELAAKPELVDAGLAVVRTELNR